MGYVAVKGGQDAIDQPRSWSSTTAGGSGRSRWRPRSSARNSACSSTRSWAKDRSIAGARGAGAAAGRGRRVRGGIHPRAYPRHAAAALRGDALNTREMFVQRRISSAFREIPGGQVLGPTRDYTQRLLNPALVRPASARSTSSSTASPAGSTGSRAEHGVTSFSKVIDLLLSEGLMSRDLYPNEDRRVVDVTRERRSSFPRRGRRGCRCWRRAETGGLMCSGYSSVRAATANRTRPSASFASATCRCATRRLPLAGAATSAGSRSPKPR